MFIFTHIEKCAGTSLHEMLSLTFPLYFHVNKNRYGGNDSRNDLTLKQYTYIKRFHPSGIGGHSIRPYLNYLNKPDYFKFTFLREPMDRYMSHYNHLLDRGWVSSMDEYLNKPAFNNYMTVKIAGEENYERAKSILASFHFIGDSGRFNQSVNFLQMRLGKKFFGNVEVKNQRKNNTNYLKKEDLTKSQQERALINNALDIQLFEYFMRNNEALDSMSSKLELKNPSMVRKKIIERLVKFKKNSIIVPLRMQEASK